MYNCVALPNRNGERENHHMHYSSLLSDEGGGGVQSDEILRYVFNGPLSSSC